MRASFVLSIFIALSSLFPPAVFGQTPAQGAAKGKTEIIVVYWSSDD